MILLEILRTVLNFLISLFSGELPHSYYFWLAILLLVQIVQSIFNYKIFKKDENFKAYIGEGLLLFICIWLGSILVSKLFAFVIEDSIQNKTDIAHYYVSLTILSIFVFLGCVEEIIQKIFKNNKDVVLVILSIIASIVSFNYLLPLTNPSFILSTSFKIVLIILVNGLILSIIILGEKYVNEK